MTMNVILDVAAVLLIVVFAAVGYKRGISHSARGLIVIGVAAACAFLLAKPVSNGVYDSFVSEPITEALEEDMKDGNYIETIRNTIEKEFDIKITDKDLEQISNSEKTVGEEIRSIAKSKGVELTKAEADESIDSFLSKEKLEEYLGDDSEDVIKLVESIIDSSENKVSDVIKALSDSDSKSAAKRLEKELAQPAIKPIVKALCAVLLFIIGVLVAKVVLMVLSVMRIIPVASTGVSFVGAIFGLAEAVLILVVLGMAAKMAIEGGSVPSNVLSEEIIEKTIVFKAFC